MQVVTSGWRSYLVGVLLIAHHPANGQIVSSGTGDLSQDLALLEFVAEPVVKRHRIVQIDYESLHTLITVAPSNYVDPSPPQTESFTLELFDDARVEVRFRYSFQGPGFWEGELVEGESVGSRIHGAINLSTKKQTIDGAIFIGDRQFVISPTSQAPYHLVWEAHPELMPNFD